MLMELYGKNLEELITQTKTGGLMGRPFRYGVALVSVIRR